MTYLFQSTQNVKNNNFKALKPDNNRSRQLFLQEVAKMQICQSNYLSPGGLKISPITKSGSTANNPCVCLQADEIKAGYTSLDKSDSRYSRSHTHRCLLCNYLGSSESKTKQHVSSVHLKLTPFECEQVPVSQIILI